MSESRKRRRGQAVEEIQPLNHEQKRIMAWLKKVRFRKKLFGGVSERDVWKKIEELNRLLEEMMKLYEESRPAAP